MIRKAIEKDIPKIGDLLEQVDLVHHNGRPDLFNIGKKYNDKEVLELINNDTTPILVWVDSGDNVWGYCFCCIQYTKGNSVLADVKTLYLEIQSKVYEVFQLLGFSQFFNIKENTEDAIHFFNQEVEVEEKVFPKIFACPVCSKRLKASKAGRFRCSECKTILAIDNQAQVFLG